MILSSVAVNSITIHGTFSHRQVRPLPLHVYRLRSSLTTFSFLPMILIYERTTIGYTTITAHYRTTGRGEA